MNFIVILILFIHITYSSHYIVDYQQIEHKLPDLSDFEVSFASFTDDIPYERVHLHV